MSTTVPAQLQLNDDGIFGDDNTSYGGPALPISRWLNASSGYHSNLAFNGLLNMGDAMDAVNRDVLQTSMTATGNGMWNITASIVEMATQFDLVNSDAAAAVDEGAGMLGGAVLENPGWIVALIVLSLMATIWRVAGARANGSSVLKEVVRTGLVVGMMVAMVNGAMQTTTVTDSQGNEVPDFGTLSPGWFVSTISKTISTTAGTLMLSDQNMVDLGGQGSGTPYTCEAYTAHLIDTYRGSSQSGQDRSAAMAVNHMWMLTGLESWIQSQSGSSGASYDTYCRILESRAGVSADAQWKVFAAAASDEGGSTRKPDNLPRSLAFNSSRLQGANGENTLNAAAVGWALCQDSGTWGDGTWKARSGWESFGMEAGNRNARSGTEGAAEELHEDCRLWWGAEDVEEDWLDNDSIIRVEGTMEAVYDNTSSIGTSGVGNAAGRDEASGYLATLHGHGAASTDQAGIMSSLVYVGSSAMALLAFGFASALILISKIMMVVMMLALFFVLLATLLPGRQSELVGSYVKKVVGTAFVAWGYSLILQVMVFVAMVFVKTAVAVWGPGSIVTILASGLAPLLAWFALVWLFKNIFNMPNPLSLRGGLALAGVAGVAGGAVASGLQNMRRKVSNTASTAGNQMVSKATGGRVTGGPGSKGRMTRGAGAMGAAAASAKSSRVDSGRIAQARERDELDVKSAGDRAGAASASRGWMGKMVAPVTAWHARQTRRNELDMDMEGGSIRRIAGRTAVRISQNRSKEPSAHAEQMRSAMRLARSGQLKQSAVEGMRATKGASTDWVKSRAVAAQARARHLRDHPGQAMRTAGRGTVGAVKIAGKSAAIATVASAGPVGWAAAAGMGAKWASGATKRSDARHQAQRNSSSADVQRRREASLKRLNQSEQADTQRKANQRFRDEQSEPPPHNPRQTGLF